MNLRAVILVSSLLLLAMPVFAREYTEVIVLKNGDRLTGNIKGSVRMCSTSIWIMWILNPMVKSGSHRKQTAVHHQN